MVQSAWHADGEATDLTYTPLRQAGYDEECDSTPSRLARTAPAGRSGTSPPPATVASNSAAGLPGRGEDDPWQGGEQWSLRSSRGAWPRAYRRTFHSVFLGALLALGMLVGTLASGHAQAIASLLYYTATASHGVSMPQVPPAAMAAPEAGRGALTPEAAPVLPDARFAIATLRVHCLLTPCEAEHEVGAGQRIYPVQGGVPCTTTTTVVVSGHREHYVYCRLDQPNVFAYSFDGAQFGCVGSWLGCHNIVMVDTTNGR